MKKTFVLLALLAAAPVWAGGDASAGEKRAQTCVACHGAQGAKPILPDYPIIAGQPEDYLAKALNDYKNGNRKNPIMASQAAPLSKQDIQNLAAYFARQKSPLHVKR